MTSARCVRPIEEMELRRLQLAAHEQSLNGGEPFSTGAKAWMQWLIEDGWVSWYVPRGTTKPLYFVTQEGFALLAEHKEAEKKS